ncbi:hypothetical protein SGFS_046660 [Streptomyces graminofaciens]|uniref:Uncharacterized protein n=1 Tax=Streptomyces graminofaciens TaxID=68212 RepID=A0ABN5VIZ3_9ACTN|nr:hypothetical protein [Streptomyces graminofaciens]BBC33372.1 hypothetical protein SGFS_046660 [Streptomyces graminofaciens]
MANTSWDAKSVYVSGTSECKRLNSGTDGRKNANATVTRGASLRLTTFSSTNCTDGLLLTRDFVVSTDLDNYWANMR